MYSYRRLAGQSHIMETRKPQQFRIRIQWLSLTDILSEITLEAVAHSGPP